MSKAEVEAILKHHLEALFEKPDLDEVMADYAEDAVHVGGGEVVRGHAAIRAMFDAVINGSMKQGETTFEVQSMLCTEDVGQTIWKAETPQVSMPFGSDSFFIRDGKIVRQTVVTQVVPKSG